VETIVLVHGAWHHGGLWQPTAEALRRLGYTVFHPTLGGNEPNGNLDAGHAESCAPVIDCLDANDLRDVILVGHSFGGSVISKVAEARPERIKRLVFWNAFVLENGQSVYDELPPPLQAAVGKSAAERGDGGCSLTFEIWRDMFIQDAPLELAEEAFGRLRPHSVRAAMDKLDLTTFWSLNIPKSFINCTEDMALTQRPEWTWHPRMSHRLGVFRLVQMPGSHEVMFTDPPGLADSIHKAGRD
jgi:pimeloyl-ACP methyl ester carboxylesterase